MKITLTSTNTTIEASVEELRASNSLADGFSNMMRGIFNHQSETTIEEEEED